ncbi:hypothetical protein ENUP19_0259G0056 [Entamoeba nuttalli]|uniref:Flavin reductase like domain-containing protein n=2 Tax=Entamoeba nuttalli TaxID=412467 RepID=K2GZ90_ENTNP|nr:hypothetical protein ENU1_137900 [Entamoeba nuttalli P19]EKE39192.1 hypothetical protein ENU1_137900 [Entamoeba nuttalli P19]|eukprot:XP_008858467.1 hypothetical protein ENU1_137900 [Entamoeba nuttalli P19]
MNSVLINKDTASRIINHGPVVMITAYDEENQRTTGMTCQWNMPLSRLSVAVKMGASSYTSKCILKTKKFVINVPTKEILESVRFFGKHHGNDVNKFEETGLHLKQCSTPSFGNLLITETVCQIELTLDRIIEETDGSKLLIGLVEACWADPKFFKDGSYTYTSKTEEKYLTLHHFGGDNFGISHPL